MKEAYLVIDNRITHYINCKKYLRFKVCNNATSEIKKYELLGYKCEEINRKFFDIDLNETQDKEYKVYTATNDEYITLISSLKIKVKHCESLFEELDFIGVDMHNVDTSEATNFRRMFHRTNMINVDVSTIDTSNAENMETAFAFIKNENFEINKLNTSKVRNLSYAFALGKGVDNVIIDGMDLSNATNISGMLSSKNCVSIVIKNVDTHNVTNISELFYFNVLNEKLEFDNIDTYNVINARQMFKGCEVPVVSLKNFNIENLYNNKADIRDMLGGAFIEKFIITGLKSNVNDDNFIQSILTDRTYIKNIIIDENTFNLHKNLDLSNRDMTFKVIDQDSTNYDIDILLTQQIIGRIIKLSNDGNRFIHFKTVGDLAQYINKLREDGYKFSDIKGFKFEYVNFEKTRELYIAYNDNEIIVVSDGQIGLSKYDIVNRQVL